MIEQNPDERAVLSKKEDRLIRMIRKLDYGEIRILIADGEPMEAEEIKKNIKL